MALEIGIIFYMYTTIRDQFHSLKCWKFILDLLFIFQIQTVKPNVVEPVGIGKIAKFLSTSKDNVEEDSTCYINSLSIEQVDFHLGIFHSVAMYNRSEIRNAIIHE